MTEKKDPRDPTSYEGNAQVSKRRIISASEVGVSLTISKEALKAVDRIEEETIKATQRVQKFSWR